jgi:beta-N-acetylhexosaminidase
MKGPINYLVVLSILFSLPLSTQCSWSEQTLTTMSLREKIGQLFMVATTANLATIEEDLVEQFLACPYKMDHTYIEHLIKEYHIGGIIFLFKGTPEQNISLMNRFQQASTIPLLNGLDAEWGLTMRLYNTIRFPRNMTLGAIQDHSLIYAFGQEIGRQCKEMGVTINFAPIADINTNPNNPVIGMRSFGENKQRVAEYAMHVMHGMQDAGIIACAKHFPGHGGTDFDSHESLPIIKHSLTHIDEIELYPFKKLIEGGVQAIMNGHLSIPSLDSTPNLPSSLSRIIVTDVLKNELGCDRLIFTDGMGMQAITNQFDPGEAELRAILAGNDILLCPVNVPKAVELIEQAIAEGLLSETELNRRVLKILQAKENLLLHKNRYINAQDALQNLSTPYTTSLKKELFSNAITLVKNNNNILPIQQKQFDTTALIQIGGYIPSEFETTINNKSIIPTYHCPSQMSKQQYKHILQTIEYKETIIIGLFDIQDSAQHRFGIAKRTFKLIKKLCKKKKKIILVNFGNPYSLSLLDKQDAIIMAYENDPDAQEAAAKVILGTLQPNGKLPITASKEFYEGLCLSY